MHPERIASVLVTLLITLVWSPSARAVDVVGDDGADRYTGSGGLILPASVPTGTRVRVASCSGCRWRLVAPCLHRPDEGAQVACMSMVTGCPGGQTRLRVWLSEDAGASWRDEGLMCVAPSGPVTVQDVDRGLHAAFIRGLPPTGVSFEPPRGVLPYLPVVFDSGQPVAVDASRHDVHGYEVVLRPRAHWHWDFGDGSVLDTSAPGSRYPDLTVSHRYDRGGPMPVTLTVTWSADFTVDGLGPFAVAEPVRQVAQTVVHVGQARAVLVP